MPLPLPLPLLADFAVLLAAGLAGVLVLPFFCVVALRTIALWNTALARIERPVATPIDVGHAKLPRYTLLIPVYDEAAIIPDLVAALGAIDYPPDLLQILLILEETDAATRAAVEAAALLPHMAVVVVPDGQPRTKPRAAVNRCQRMNQGGLVHSAQGSQDK